MIGLLADLPQPGYPADYLLARLAARRQQWPALLAPGRDGDGWAALAREWLWLYGQLPWRLRRELAPLFLFFELRPLFLFLRGLAGSGGEECRALLAPTLLADEIKRLLLRERECAAAVRHLARFWPAGFVLVRLHAAAGLAALEQELTRQVLAAVGRSSALGAFRVALIDRENLVALAKRVRWQAGLPFRYSAGGTLADRSLAQAEGGREARLPARLAGPFRQAVAQGVWPLEEFLNQRAGQRLRAAAHEGQGAAAAVAAYVWGAHGVVQQQALAAG